MKRVAMYALLLAAIGSAGQAATILVGDTQPDGGTPRVLEFGLDGTFLGVFASGYKAGGIQLGPNRNVFINEGASGGPIREYEQDGTFVGNAFNGVSGVRPDDLAVDSAGNLYFNSPGWGGTTQEVRRVDSATSSTVVVPQNFDDPSGLTGDDSLDTPRGLAIDGNDDVLVADRENQRLLRFDGATSELEAVLVTSKFKIQAPLVAGTGNIFYSHDGMTAIEEIDAFGNSVNNYDYPDSDPHGLMDSVLLPDGDLLVAAYNDDMVYRLDTDTGTYSTFASGSYGGAALDGTLYVAVIPEPASLALLVLGSLIVARRR